MFFESQVFVGIRYSADNRSVEAYHNGDYVRVYCALQEGSIKLEQILHAPLYEM